MNRPWKKIISLVIFCAIFCTLIQPAFAHAQEVALTVDNYSEQSGSFTLTADARFFVVTTQRPDDALEQTLRHISAEFAAAGKPCDTPPALCWGEYTSVAAGDLIFGISDKLGAEAYEIRITNENVTVAAGDTDGILYAAHTILRLLLADDSNRLDCCVITDTPDTEHRAVMLDCARKYWSVPWLKNLIAQMSWLGYNELELHLTEDQGIRFDVWSGEPDCNGNDFSWLVGYDSGWNEDYPDPNGDRFYTAEEMRELAEFARQYHIELIPGIELPSHCDVMVRRYAEFVGKHPEFSFSYQGIGYTAQGMVTDGITMRPYDEEAYPNVDFSSIGTKSTDATLDVTNPVARAFGLAVVQAYADFFYGLGCKKINIGFDELSFTNADGWHSYARDHIDGGESAYDTAADFANELAAQLQQLGYTSIRAYNDVLYNSRRNIALSPAIELCIWSLKYSEETEQYLQDGRTLYNCIQNYCYYVLRSNNRSNGGDARDPENTWWSFHHSTEDRIYEQWSPARLYNADENGLNVTKGLGGGFFLIWSDFGGWRTETQVWNGEDDTDGTYNLIDRLWSNSIKMWNWSVHNVLEFESFALMRDCFRLFPGYRQCTTEPQLPQPQQLTCVPSADHAQLHALLEQENAQPIDKTAFSEESVARYEQAYAKAVQLDENYFSTAKELTDAVLALQGAVQSLSYREQSPVISVTVAGRMVTAIYPDSMFGGIVMMRLPEFEGYEIDRIEGSAVLKNGVLFANSPDGSVTVCLKPIQ